MSKTAPLLIVSLVTGFLSLPGSIAKALELDRIYSAGMVLQRSMELPIRGSAKAGAEVTVSFAGQTANGVADAQGRWTVVIPPLEASAENRTLSVASDGKKVDLENVLVGEVWLGSGQSNMAGKVRSYRSKDPTLDKIAQGTYPEIRVREGSEWVQASPESIANHSALLFAFGERLHRELGVPVGLFVGAVGGTPSGAWIPKEIYQASDPIKNEIDAFAKTYDKAAALQRYEKRLAAWEQAAAKAKAEGKKVRGRRPQPPGDPGDATRRPIGSLFDRYIRPSVGFPIRGVLWDQGEARTGILGLDQYTCMSELIRGWRQLWGQGEFPFLFVQKPSGKGNAYSKEDPVTREAEDFSELPDVSKVDGGGAERFLYVRLMRDNADAWMVPCCDLGASIHPINKWGYGNRAAEVAAQKVYRKSGVQAYGPIYESHQTDGNQVTVKFRETAGGLVAAHSESVNGFALADESGRWHWATATITGPDTVRLVAGQVEKPVHIRYAYAANRTWANLFNKEGLPALCFTTE